MSDSTMSDPISCPHPAFARLVVVPRAVRFAPEVEQLVENLVPAPVAWCRLCGSLCREGVWTEPASLVLLGWACKRCGVFNGAAKEFRTECRSCEAPFDMEAT